MLQLMVQPGIRQSICSKENNKPGTGKRLFATQGQKTMHLVMQSQHQMDQS